MARSIGIPAARRLPDHLRLLRGGRVRPAPAPAETRPRLIDHGDDPEGLLRRAVAGHFRHEAAEDLVLAWIFVLDRRSVPLAASRLLPVLSGMTGESPTHQQSRLLALVTSIAAHGR